jgi:hypothetical protein
MSIGWGIADIGSWWPVGHLLPMMSYATAAKNHLIEGAARLPFICGWTVKKNIKSLTNGINTLNTREGSP